MDSGDTPDSADICHEESEQVFDLIPKYHTKFALGDFNAKSEREVIFKQTIGTKSLHQESNDSAT